MSTVSKYWHTLRYLKPIQIAWRIRYMVRRKTPFVPFRGFYVNKPRTRDDSFKLLCDSLASSVTFSEDNVVRLLNKSKRFENSIDWNFEDYGKLWTYNLTFFDFLANPNMTLDNGLRLIHDFIDNAKLDECAYDSHPISVRVINWIKFVLLYRIRDERIDISLSHHIDVLLNNLEYHLLGNHLLENAFGLYFGAVYFNDANLLSVADKILNKELDEQFLVDGGHFELSPMYHQTMLFRLLDCLNLQTNHRFENSPLREKITNKACMALAWLNAISFSNGDIPMVNDSTYDVSPTTSDLNDLANRLSLKASKSKLESSGYRFIRNKHYELFVDVAPVGPNYIPGHAHSDTLNFILHIDKQPVIVETGISTYEKNDRRQLERSTASHNTVKIGGFEQSEVWGGFRVARRARISSLKENESCIEASHDGYSRIGISHKRIFRFELDDKIVIEDQVSGSEEYERVSYIHFHPSISIVENDGLFVSDNCRIKVEGASDIKLDTYEFAQGYNFSQSASKLIISFQSHLLISIFVHK